MVTATTTTTLNRDTVQSSLLKRAQNDVDFRALLLSNPHAAIKSMLGFDPIPALNIRVLEEQPGEVVLVLPRNLQEDELADETLDMAAGGVAARFWSIDGGITTQTWFDSKPPLPSKKLPAGHKWAAPDLMKDDGCTKTWGWHSEPA